MSLMEKMLKTGPLKGKVASDSKMYKKKEFIKTNLPILNVAFSGSLDGGLATGITVIAGPSKSFKSLLTLHCLKAFQDKYPEGICLFYDCEYGITEDYMKSVGVDPDRVLTVEIENVEQLAFDLSKKLEAVGKGDKVFIMVDSIGNLASKKEVEDALNEKSVADMSRAKSIGSLFRIVTPIIVKKDITAVFINHTYKEIAVYPKDIVSGGTKLMYSANQVFIMSKAQIKEGTEIVGYSFTINIEKSRFVKEKAKLPFTVKYEDGIGKWSSMFELAEECGFIDKPKVGWYVTTDPETGEVDTTNRRQGQIEKDDAFFAKLIKNEQFKKFVENKFKLSTGQTNESNVGSYEDDDSEEETVEEE